MHYYLNTAITLLFALTFSPSFPSNFELLSVKLQTTPEGTISFRSFADWCLNKDSISEAQKRTVEVLLRKTKTSDCYQANEKLSNLTELILSGSVIEGELTDLTEAEKTHLFKMNQISDLSPLSQLTNLTSLHLWNNQIRDISPLSKLSNLTSLDLSYNQIRDINPLSKLSNLTSLQLTSNQIREISPLSKLTHLTYLQLTDNPITNISPLSGLTNLTSLGLSGNQISDIRSLSKLTNLTSLHLSHNQIADFSPLSSLTKLTSLDLRENQITQKICPVYPETICEFTDDAERISQQAKDRYEQGQFREALETFQAALTIYTKAGDRVRTGDTLNQMGDALFNLSEYAQALELYQKALKINQTSGDRGGQVTTLASLGVAHERLGQYQKALVFLEQAWELSANLEKNGKSRSSWERGMLLTSIATVYDKLGNYPESLRFSKLALAFYRTASMPDSDLPSFHRIALALDRVGVAYFRVGNIKKALVFLEKALDMSKRWYFGRESGYKAGEGRTLNNLGDVYFSLGETQKALEFYQQALVLRQTVEDKAGEAATLNNIGFLLEKQNQPDLAIAFYKQSVNITEEIRKDLRVLPKEQQQSYTQTVADTYRRLADLLLKQDRVLEAQRVLDLLKVQELDDYLRNVRGNQQTQQGVDYLPPEQQLLAQYNAKLTQVVQLGKELDTLQKIPPEERTPQQEQRRREIQTEQQKLTRDYLDFIRSPQIVALVQQLSRTTGGENLNPQLLRNLQDNLKKLSQDAVLLYPLILDDRLEVVLVTPYAPPIRRPVPVKREELNRTIAEFRSALTSPNSNAQEPAQKLYNWLIQPIEPALKEANAKTIIYAPDGQLRYIPLAALYDGNQWLVQKYRINNITALSLTEWNQKPQTLKVLAGAFTQGNYSFQVGGKTFNFGGLPSAGKEVENLAATVPGTTKLLDRNFSQKDTVARMSDYSILHLATHASFVTGQPEDSFILFGNGDRANFRDVETWPLTNTDLVVLSACETGVGGKLGDGTEILGFGYLMQQAGARAAIASLWSVDDGGTQVLMNAFYTAVENGMSKAEALRQAQIALITKDLSAVGGSRGEEAWIEVVSTRTGLPLQVSNNLNHPYYWAPFILIGNGL